MWDKLKRKVLVIAAILLMICSIPKVVNAAPVVINVSTGAEFYKPLMILIVVAQLIMLLI